MTALTRIPAVAALALVGQCIYASSIEQGAICANAADDGCVAPVAPSLLQKKVSKHDAKGIQLQEQSPSSVASEAVCTGIAAQGRCWFLSETGESCAHTCSVHYGRRFSYAIANPEEPLTPLLVQHEPKLKQEPWSPLECYVTSEDRFHPANQNAAKHLEEDRHLLDDIGDWSNELCKLACPCGGSLSEPARLEDSVEKPASPEVPVEETARPKESVEETVQAASNKECGWLPASSCEGEFTYQGVQYAGCTTADHDTPWCSNTKVYYGSWSKCIYSCPTTTTTTPPKPTERVQKCNWQPKPDCAKTFDYKGGKVTGCTNLDYPTPWCSRDAIHRGSWDTCTRVCSWEVVAPSSV